MTTTQRDDPTGPTNAVRKVERLLSLLAKDAADSVLSHLSRDVASSLPRIFDPARPVAEPTAHDEPLVQEFVAETRRFIRHPAHAGHVAGQGPHGDRRVALPHELSEMDPSRIAHILQAELPQTTAAVLLGMSPKQAGQLLAQLPDAYRMIVLPRLADSQLPRPWALECVADALLATLASQAVTASPDPAGRLGLHAILGQSDPDVRQILWSSIERVRPDLAERLKV